MRLLVTVLVLVVLGCQGRAPSSPTGAPPRETAAGAAATPVTAGETAVVELRLDETVTLGALRLRWLELNDSRCPVGVQCVWEGQAVVTVELSRDDLAPQTVELILRPGMEAGAETVAGHELRPLKVEPYPREGVTPERSDHVATVEIRSL